MRRKVKKDEILTYVKNNIGNFHAQRIESLNALKLKVILRKKNPYLFRAKYLLTADKIVGSLTDAFISSNEETIFGGWLEELAIYINKRTFNGWKSGITGIDLEFDKDSVRYIVAIKSGPNWGNSSQIAKMRSDFIAAKKTLRTSNSKIQVVAVNGCCYGRIKEFDRGDYFKYCGQQFWEFISDDDALYTDIIEPLAYKAKEKNEEFIKKYSMMINKFVLEFAKDFCNNDGEINWDKLVRFNSGKHQT
jgi:hypothetical protein